MRLPEVLVSSDADIPDKTHFRQTPREMPPKSTDSDPPFPQPYGKQTRVRFPEKYHPYLSVPVLNLLHQMQFARFRFATLHKQYLLFDGRVPAPYPAAGLTDANSFLACCCYDPARGLICILLAETRINEGSITCLAPAPQDKPVILTGTQLAERTCTPVRRSALDTSPFAWAETAAETIDPSPQTNDTILLSRICGICTHHRGRNGWRSCPAFPDRIPDELWNAETDPKIPCGQGIGFVPKEPRLFLEIFDPVSGRVIYRYEADGDPRNPEHIRETSDYSPAALTTFQNMMHDWHTHLAGPVKEYLHCAEGDGAFITELSAINVAMTINRQEGREVYRIIDEFPEYPLPPEKR